MVGLKTGFNAYGFLIYKVKNDTDFLKEVLNSQKFSEEKETYLKSLIETNKEVIFEYATLLKENKGKEWPPNLLTDEFSDWHSAEVTYLESGEISFVECYTKTAKLTKKIRLSPNLLDKLNSKVEYGLTMKKELESKTPWYNI